MACLQFLSEPLTKEQFQAAQLAFEENNRDGSVAGPSERRSLSPEAPPPAKRAKTKDDRAFTSEDFRVIGIPNSKIQEWYEQFPALGKRNFYLVQKHYATAKHFDLRLQLDGATVSFAIPEASYIGLRTPRGTLRQAFETNPHPINYTLYEGHSLGHTICWDIGTYKILPTQKKEREKQARRANLSTDEEDSSQDREREELGIAEDKKQENLFRKAHQHAAFITYPNRHLEKKRSFVIELNGHRYRGLRLTFFRQINDIKSSRPRGAPKDSEPVHKRHWGWSISAYPGSEGNENTDIGENSILTQRSMEKLKEDTAKQKENGEQIAQWAELEDLPLGMGEEGVGGGGKGVSDEMEKLRKLVGPKQYQEILKNIGLMTGIGGLAGSSRGGTVQDEGDGFEVYDPQLWDNA